MIGNLKIIILRKTVKRNEQNMVIASTYRLSLS